MLGNGYRHCIDLEPAQSGADDYGTDYHDKVNVPNSV